MKWIAFILILGFSPICFGQVDTLKHETLEFDFDSVIVSVWDIYFKDYSSRDIEYSEVPPSKELIHVQLTKEDGHELLSQLKDPDSYDGTRANLSHHDVEIEFYHSGEVINNLEISALSGNVDINNLSNGESFRNNVSNTLGSYLVDLMKKYQIIESIGYDEIDLTGLMLDNSD
ncbi:MAG: hypothetical protein P8P74_09630 [Crocinitomicaceae bacterium]|nr:hypothetical protein [Crocinitomicaceae bacterium]